jgi:hypothetical protein
MIHLSIFSDRKPLITAFQMGHHVLCMFYMVSNFYVGNPECTMCDRWNAFSLLALLDTAVCVLTRCKNPAGLYACGPYCGVCLSWVYSLISSGSLILPRARRMSRKMPSVCMGSKNHENCTAHSFIDVVLD